MKHFDTIKRLNLVVVILLACIFTSTAANNGNFLVLENGDRISLHNSEDFTCDNAINGGTISGDQKGCADPTYDPTALSNLSLPTGGTGTIEYIWISTTDDLSSDPVWTPIAGSTGSSYDPGPISTETSYRRCARRSGCIDYVAESNIVTVTLDCCDNVTDGGIIEKDQSICGTSIDVAPITNVTLPSGGSGDLEYLWLQSTTCTGYFDGNADWSIVPNSNSASLDPGVITQTTCYIRCVRRKGCIDYIGESNIVTVTVNPVPNVSIAINSNPDCDNSGKLTASGSGGEAPYTYLWNTGATGNMISGLGGGTYSVVVTDANGCSAGTSEDLTASQAPSGTVATTDVTCSDGANGMATVTASGGTGPYTYTFSAGTASGNKATNLGAGSYNVVITDAVGCSVTVNFSIAKPSPVYVNIVKDADPKCDNSGKVTATASGGSPGYTYVWSNGETTSMISSLSAGTYTVTATDSKGCTNVQSITLVAANAPTATVTSTNVTCNGANDGTATVTASGGTGSYTYLWNNGMINATRTGLTPGTYTVVVTDGNNCSVSSSVTISEPTAITLTVTGTDETCNNDNGTVTATVGGGTPGYTYAWSNGATTASISGLSAGTYGVTVRDANNCSVYKSVTISNSAGPSANATGSALDCHGDNDGTASVSVTGGTGTISYAWSNGGSASSINGLAAGTYSVTATDANGCSTTATATVSQPTPLTASSNGNNATCGQSNGSATASAAGGTAGYTFSWSNGASGATATGLAAGSYTVTATDANGCTATSSVSIGNDGGPSVNATSTNVTCNGGGDGSASATATGGSGTVTYLWSTGANSATINGLTAGTYSVTATDANGCQDSKSVTITEPTAITLTVTGTDETCNNDNGSVTATVGGGTPGYTYAWSNGATTASISGLSAGTYGVTVRDANNCSVYKSVTISNTAGPSANATGSALDCHGDNDGTASVSVTGGTGTISYAWSNGGSASSINGLAAGTYSVTATDANGCSTTATATVSQPTPLTASSNGNNASCGQSNGSATASAAGGTAGYTFSWSSGASGATATGLAAGSYTVTATDANGCTATSTLSIGNDGGPSVNATSTNVTCNGGADGSASATATGGSGTVTYLWSTGANSATINGLTAGTYSVTATDANGCQDSKSVTITEPTAITLTVTGTDETCNNDNGSVTATVGGGTPGYTYAWSNGATTASISGLSAGTYGVTVRDANNCSVYKSVTISNTAGPSANATGSALDCHGDNDGTASVSVTGGTGTISYAWSNGGSASSINGLAAGTYSVTATDANGCSTTATATVSQPTPLTASSNGNNASCGQSNGSATASAAGGTAGYTFSWSSGASGATATGLAAGSYTVTATDANGCSATSTLSIGNDGGPSVNATSTNVTCNGGADGSASATATGGSGTVTYLWSTGANSATIDGLAAGTYSVTTTDANGCQDSESVTITAPSAVTLTLTGTDETCNNDNGTVTATVGGGTPGYTYAWSNGATTASISGLSAGTYGVTVRDANNCSVYKSVTISNTAGPSANATGSTLDCHGDNDGTASVAVTGGTGTISYSWSNGGSASSINGLAAGTYSVTATDANGCSTTATATVTQPTPLTASSNGNNASCGQSNGSATASAAGGTPAYTFSWSNGASGATATGLAAGSYTVTATDANGCTATSTLSIGNDGGPSVNATSTNVTCNGGADGSASATATGGSGTVTYLWSTGANSATINGLAAGTYSVTATDANGCQDSESVTITEPTPVTLTVTGTNETCNNDNGTVTATVGGGTPGYTYAWSNGATTASISGLSAGTYGVTVRDANNCSVYKSVTISNEAGPSANATGSALDCHGDNDGTASVAVTGGTGTISYSWNNGGSASSINGLAAGTYSVTATDANGCSTTATATVSQPTPLTASSNGNNASCGESNGSATASAAGGTAGYTFSWSSGASGATATGLAAGSYTVTATDANGCSATSSVSIGNDGGPTVTVSGSNLFCNGVNEGSAIATVIGGSGTITYLWNNGSTESSLWGIAAGTYSVTVTDANGCMASNSVTVTEPSAVSVSASGNNETCDNNNGSASASASGGTPGYTYAWSNGETTASISGLPAGSYSVTVTDNNGCTATDNVTISNEAGPNLVAEGSPLDCHGDSNGTAWASATGGTAPLTYLWSNGATDANIDGLSVGTYSVTVTDANGCTATTFTIVTEPTELIASASGTDATCSASNGTANASANGGTPGYTFLWSTGATSSSIGNLAAGNYTVTITDSKGCADVASVNIGNVGGPSITITGSTNVTCHDDANGTATANTSGGTSPYTYAWSSGATTATATGLDAGGYTVTVTDANGCSASTGITITQPNPLQASIIMNDVPGCNDNGSLTVSGSGGSVPYTYLWSTSATGPTISGLSGGTYTVTITDANGCSVSETRSLVDSTPGTITVTTIDIKCNGDNDGKATATLSEGRAPIVWSWSGGTQSNNMSSNLAAGSYGVTATDAYGCVSTATFDITQPDFFMALMNTESAGCDDNSGKATVTPQGGTAPYTYLWSTGATTAMMTNLAPGSYGVTVTDVNGCTATGTANVSNDADLVCSSRDVKPATCYGGNDGRATAVATGGQGPYTYAWSNGANQATATNLQAGSYGYTVTDANGCSCVGSVTITQPFELVCSANIITELSGYNAADAVAKATAAGGNGHPSTYSYAWSNGSTQMTASNLSPGMYTVTVTDINGCSCDSKVTVTNKSQLGDTVFRDLDGDGIQDAGEPGIGGVTVILTNLDDMTTMETMTNGNGNYLFDGLDAGNYKVTFVLPNGTVFSPSNVGGNDTVDSDANEMGMTESIALGQGESNLTIDAGIIREGINVGDYVWIDTDQDGIQDFNEDGIGGILVTLTNTMTNSTRTTTTNGNGYYLFMDVVPGKYKISFSNIPAGYTFTAADQIANDELDSDANAMGMTEEFMVMLGDADDLSFDAGIHVICDNVIDPGVIGNDQKLCGSNTPETLVNITLPSGGNGMLEYVWLKNESGNMTAPGFDAPNWVVIPNSNSPYYYPGIVNTSTFYVRCTRRKGCTSFVESNVIRVDICDLPGVDVIYESEDNCFGDLVNVEGVNAGAGATYEWSFPGAVPSTASTRIVNDILYGDIGNYDFTLTVTSDEGCVSTKSFMIWIGCTGNIVINDVEAKATSSKTVMIDWSLETPAEDNEYFVEQSRDGITYQVVGSTMGEAVTDYNYEDMTPKLGTSFYRIKHVDQVGNHVTSEPVQVVLQDGAIKNMFAYPNPAIDNIQLELFEPLEEEGMLYIIDGNARIIKTVVISANTQIIDVDLSTLARGMYFIEVQYDGFKKYRQKVVKAEK